MPTTIDIDRLADELNEQELGLIASKLLRRMAARFGTSVPFIVRDENQQPVASCWPIEPGNDSAAKAEFIREVDKRASSPSQKYLTAEEFLAAIPRK